MGRGAADEFDFTDVQRSGISGAAISDPPTREQLQESLEALAPGESYSFENGASALRLAIGFMVRWPSQKDGFRANEADGAVSDALAYHHSNPDAAPNVSEAEKQAIIEAYETHADVWVPASSGSETPVRYRNGRTLLYCFNPASLEHAYLDVEEDRILSSDEAMKTILL